MTVTCGRGGRAGGQGQSLVAADALLGRVGHGCGHLQAAGVGVLGRRRHLVRLPDFDDLPAVQHGDPVADLMTTPRSGLMNR
jgi:hypothetical protein